MEATKPMSSNIGRSVDWQTAEGRGTLQLVRRQVKDASMLSYQRVLSRVETPEKRERPVRRAEMLFDWAGSTFRNCGTCSGGARSRFVPIAQHYGIPNHYIDFTTDPGVAGFFARTSATPSP